MLTINFINYKGLFLTFLVQSLYFFVKKTSLHFECDYLLCLVYTVCINKTLSRKTLSVEFLCYLDASFCSGKEESLLQLRYKASVKHHHLVQKMRERV